MREKKIIRFLLFLLVILISFSLAHADYDPNYLKMCLHDGQSVPNAETPYYTCSLKLSDCCCEVCVRAHNLDPRGVHPYKCDQQSCNYMEGGLDELPPIITINNPTEGDVETSRGVLLDINVNEYARLERYDELKRSWILLCTLCNHYSRSRSFGDGPQTLKIRATDKAGNPSETEVNFFVDSQDPRIRKTEPKKGFADGNFYVEFTEDNPETLILHYGNSYVEQEIDMEDCYEVRRSTLGCNAFADLSAFDGQQIEYWFTLEDIAGNSDESSHVDIMVDMSAPLINDVSYDKDERYVTFNIDITELNLEEVSYLDEGDSRPRWKRLCNKLENGICEKRVSFKDGQHYIVINVTDEAGNFASEFVSFFTDSRAPGISRTEPRSGFANGFFEAHVKDENPTLLILNYGNADTGYRDELIELSECSQDRGRYYCGVYIELDDYDAQEIEYWFYVEDIVANTDESKHIELDVDATYPEINNPNGLFNIEGRYVTFNIDITELNFDSVEYTDLSSSRPRPRTLCRRLEDGICTAKKSFSEGHHDVSIQVTDQAGNAIGRSIDFDIVY